MVAAQKSIEIRAAPARKKTADRKFFAIGGLCF